MVTLLCVWGEGGREVTAASSAQWPNSKVTSSALLGERWHVPAPLWASVSSSGNEEPQAPGPPAPHSGTDTGRPRGLTPTFRPPSPLCTALFHPWQPRGPAPGLPTAVPRRSPRRRRPRQKGGLGSSCGAGRTRARRSHWWMSPISPSPGDALPAFPPRRCYGAAEALP